MKTTNTTCNSVCCSGEETFVGLEAQENTLEWTFEDTLEWSTTLWFFPLNVQQTRRYLLGVLFLPSSCCPIFVLFSIWFHFQHSEHIRNPKPTPRMVKSSTVIFPHFQAGHLRWKSLNGVLNGVFNRIVSLQKFLKIVIEKIK